MAGAAPAHSPVSWNFRYSFRTLFQPAHASSSIHMAGKRPCAAWRRTFRLSAYHLRQGWKSSFCSALRSAAASYELASASNVIFLIYFAAKVSVRPQITSEIASARYA